MNARAIAAALALLGTSAASCALLQAEPQQFRSYTLPSGVGVRDLVVPRGKPIEMGQTVTIHYEGRLTSGEIVDSSYETGRPVTFVLGSGEVPGGLEEGIVGMVLGGRRQLVLPPQLAYGAAGVPGRIPPEATLVFVVEVLAVEDGPADESGAGGAAD